MKEQPILSTGQRSGARPLAFDVCQVGAVLRTVLYVEAVVAVGLLYVSQGVSDWAARLALLTAGALPATLLWLVAGCALKRSIARLSWRGQYAAGAVLGTVAGLFACAVLAMLGVRPMPWLAGMCTGAVLAVSVAASLVWRVRGRTPAGTTARLAELQSRIRPHFLFNTLNSAIALVRQDPAKAETILEDLADLFHHALSDQGEASTVAQEIELARRYLEIEQVRFGERLRVDWSLDQRASLASLPPLILQPLVENAVKHGVEPSPAGAQLRISSRVRNQMAVITVSNTVPSGQGAGGHGIALRNVRERLRLLHDLQGQFRCTRTIDSFQARIEVPLPNG
ncbi:MAG: histidine kinase [Burkholderiaceae bacterium]|jgi:two-component system sensor histidine kinase AlgZ|nr:histidine kinase [Burkholderiaceae bacterium]